MPKFPDTHSTNSATIAAADYQRIMAGMQHEFFPTFADQLDARASATQINATLRGILQQCRTIIANGSTRVCYGTRDPHIIAGIGHHFSISGDATRGELVISCGVDCCCEEAVLTTFKCLWRFFRDHGYLDLDREMTSCVMGRAYSLVVHLNARTEVDKRKSLVACSGCRGW